MISKRTHFLFSIALALGAATAHAQPSQQGSAQPANLPAPPAGDTLPGIVEDANSGINYVTPTALMPPQGTWDFTSTELVFVGMSYSFTDNFLMSLHTLVPIVPEEFQPYLLTAKLGGLNSGKLHFAGHAAFAGAILKDDLEDDSFNTLTLGGSLTVCIDDGCHSYVNGYGGVGFLIASGGNDGSYPLFLSAAAAARVSNHIKLLVEIDTGAIVGDYNDGANGFLGFYGVRFAYSSIAVNAGLARPFGPDVEMDTFPLGFPWVGFTYRGLPGAN